MEKKTVIYDAATISQVILMLEHIPVSGSGSVKAMSLVFEALKHPIQETSENKTTIE